MSVLVSVIMPAYNVEKYIGKSIESIINQEYNNWELIVVNDGSKDNTREVVKSFTLTDPRIKLYDQENSGVSAARNRGISLASGKYLAFLDGDDLWDKRFLAETVAAKETNHVDMVFSGYKSIYEDGRYRNFIFQYMDGDILLPYLQLKVGMHIGSVLIDKSAINEHGIRFTEGCAMGEDVEFLIKVLCITKVSAVRKELMIYRLRRPGSASNSSFSWQVHINVIKSFERAQKFVDERYLGRAKCTEILNILNNKIGYYRYWILWKMIKYGYHNEAMEMLADPKCIKDLENISESDLTLKRRLRFKAIMSKNEFIWKCCNLFKTK